MRKRMSSQQSNVRLMNDSRLCRNRFDRVSYERKKRRRRRRRLWQKPKRRRPSSLPAVQRWRLPSSVNSNCSANSKLSMTTTRLLMKRRAASKPHRRRRHLHLEAARSATQSLRE
jgi:hypothetical protein